MVLFSYVVRWDHGFAPNPFYGVCSLATCKPGLRKKANVGDWVLGTGPSKRGLADRAVFLMRVDEITSFDAYWRDPRFLAKRPVLSGSFKVRFGDNIYHRANPGSPWIQADSRHSQHGAVANQKNLNRDTGTTDKVLLSMNFKYWGDQAPQLPQQFAHFAIGRPGYEYDFPAAKVAAFLQWADGLGQTGRLGDPIEWKWARWWR
ncbi:hypothetical protein NKH73_14780 [Mesorhizobium sp. M0938]|uniref:Nmad2 family putative nucleotide modification protein n=1 Tax=unclassified Mesorhizobium TaxID=325217 RepID=UPI00333AF6A5